MGYLRYEGYMGSVEYDEKEECLYGHVQGMRDMMLNYKGKSVAELENKFKSSIDKYLAKCQKKVLTPSDLTMVLLTSGLVQSCTFALP